eukprot:1151899-Pyramimonas_sp.AAC.1
MFFPPTPSFPQGGGSGGAVASLFVRPFSSPQGRGRGSPPSFALRKEEDEAKGGQEVEGG